MGPAQRTPLPDFETYDHAAALDLPEDPVAIGDIAFSSDVVAIVAGAKAHKTFLLLQLAVAATHGLSWLGREVQQGNVLLVNFELKPNRIFRRIAALREALEPQMQSRRIDLLNLRGCSFSPREVVDHVVGKLTSGEYGWVLLDPLYRLETELDARESGQITKLLLELQRLCNERGVTLVYIDHTPKGDMSGWESVDMAAGSASKGRFVDAIVTLRKHEDWTESWRVYVLEVISREMPSFAPSTIRFEWPRYVTEPDVPARIKRAGRGGHNRLGGPDDVLRAMRLASKRGEIIRIVQAALPSASLPSIERWLSLAARQRLIAPVSGYPGSWRYTEAGQHRIELLEKSSDRPLHEAA